MSDKDIKLGQPTSPSPGQQTLTIQQAIDAAVQHHKAGRFPEAERIYQQILQTSPRQPVALHLLGVIAHQTGKSGAAVDLISKAIAIKPDFAEAHNNLGAALKELGKLDEAVASYHKALALQPGSADAHNNLGNALQDLGKLNEAVTSYHRAFAIKPDFADAHNNLGNALKNLGRLDEAVASYRRAVAIKPDFAAAHSHLGNALKELGRLDEAVASHQRAIASQPDYAEAHYNLCETLEMTNNTEALREAVNKARKNCPGYPLLTLWEAQLLKRDGDYAAARTVLEAEVEEIVDASYLMQRAFLLGELCDRLDDAQAAYFYFEEGNRRTRETPEAKQADREGYLARIDVLKERFTVDWVAGWRHLESGNGRPDPVFLVGFPRSGTTLLDTILRSHQAINVVEEKPAILSVMKALGRYPAGYPDGLSALDPTELAALREIYFAELDKHREPQDQTTITVDKLPLNTIEAGLIQRIFPSARFLFAQRHPCDCVLSCFMQSFEINDAMVNFLDLEDAARLYDKVMTLWQQYRAVLPLAVYTVRYESLIEGFEETLTPLLDFLGLDWDDDLERYAETAQARGIINTPSYNQVTQPLYTRSRGRWERYREQMHLALPLLLPWAQRFGYES